MLRCALVASLLAMTLVPALHPAAADTDDDEKAVHAATAALYRACETGDVETIEALMATDWEMFITLPNAQSAVPRDAFLQTFPQNFRPGGVDIIVNREDCRVGETVAFCRSDEYFDWNRGEENPPLRVHFLSTYALEKIDGTWKMTHTHHSYVSPPPEPESGKGEAEGGE